MTTLTLTPWLFIYKVQISLLCLFNLTLFYPLPSISDNILTSIKGGGLLLLCLNVEVYDYLSRVSRKKSS